MCMPARDAFESKKRPKHPNSWGAKSESMVDGAITLLLALSVALFAWDKHRSGADSLSSTDAASDSAPTGALSAKNETLPASPPMRAERAQAIALPEAEPIEPNSAQTLVPAIRDADAEGSVSLLEFDREAVLGDAGGRIDDEFSIPPGLKDRVGFWFDVYTKWDEHQRVIHNALHPWIVYRVVDVTPIIASKTPKRRWMRNQKADEFVDAEAARIRAALKSVAARKHLRNLNPYERDVVNALKALGGKAQTRARAAIGETRVQMGQRNFFEQGLRISPRYLPEMERIFSAKKLPIELTRLPLVESSFNKFATSKDGAAGIWQFMGNTGGKFMLINGQIDERRSPFKATEAAARLLKENHMILYRKWPLALTAYNHGPGGVRKATKAMGTQDLSRIVGKYRSKMFGFASSNFYTSFLAALHAQSYNDKIWSGLRKEAALDTHVVKLPRPYGVKRLMKIAGLDDEKLLLYNPDLNKVLKNRGVVPRGFRLHLPVDLRTRVERLFAGATSGEKRLARRKS